MSACFAGYQIVLRESHLSSSPRIALRDCAVGEQCIRATHLPNSMLLQSIGRDCLGLFDKVAAISTVVLKRSSCLANVLPSPFSARIRLTSVQFSLLLKFCCSLSKEVSS